MQSVFGTKRKESPMKIQRRVERKWWHFMRKSKVKPIRALDIQHHVDFNQDEENHDRDDVEYYEMEDYFERDNNYFRYVFERKFIKKCVWCLC